MGEQGPDRTMAHDEGRQLRRLSAMYSFVRQRLGGDHERTPSGPDTKTGGDLYQSHKCIVDTSYSLATTNLDRSLGSS